MVVVSVDFASVGDVGVRGVGDCPCAGVGDVDDVVAVDVVVSIGGVTVRACITAVVGCGVVVYADIVAVVARVVVGVGVCCVVDVAASSS